MTRPSSRRKGCARGASIICSSSNLPNEAERAAIWAIQVRKYGREAEDFDVQRIARESDRMTGSEIEQAFVEALYQGFAAGKEPDNAIVSTVIAQSVPLATTMAEKIESLRNWAKSRAQMATSLTQGGMGRNGRKLVGMPVKN